MKSELLRKIEESGVYLEVHHRCGHVFQWLMLLEETTPDEVRADLEQQDCRRCRREPEFDQ